MNNDNVLCDGEQSNAGVFKFKDGLAGAFSIYFGGHPAVGRLFVRNGFLDFEGEATPAAHHFFAYIKTLWNQVDRDHGLFVEQPTRDKDTGMLKHAKSSRLTLWAPVCVSTGEVDTICYELTNAGTANPSRRLRRGWEWRQFEMFPVVSPAEPVAEPVGYNMSKKKILDFLQETIEQMQLSASEMAAIEKYEVAGGIQQDMGWYKEAKEIVCDAAVKTLTVLKDTISSRMLYHKTEAKNHAATQDFINAALHTRAARKFSNVLQVIEDEEARI